MSRSRPRNTVLFLALALLAAWVPFVPLVICAIGFVAYAIVAHAPARTAVRAGIVRDEQPRSCLAVVPLRGPPSLLV